VPDGRHVCAEHYCHSRRVAAAGCKARALGFTLRLLVRTFLAWLRSALPVSFASRRVAAAGCKARALGFTLRLLVRTFLAWLRSALPVSFASQPLVVKRARCAYRCALF